MENFDQQREVTVLYLQPDKMLPEVKTFTTDEKGSCLASLQQLVKGRIDLVRAEDYNVEGPLADCDFWVNDEGICNGLEANIALNLAEAKRRNNINYAGLCFGPVVVAKHNEDGDTLSIPKEEIPQAALALMKLCVYNNSRGD